MALTSELSLFFWLLTEVNLADAEMPSRGIEAALRRLGFKTTKQTWNFLCSVKINHPAPLHLDVTRAVASNPVLRRRLHGMPVDEFLLELLGFEEVRPLLARPFFQRYRFHLGQQESLWWAAEHFNRALVINTMQARPITSPDQLLLAGKQAGSRESSR
jgi:hypothetical protein